MGQMSYTEQPAFLFDVLGRHTMTAAPIRVLCVDDNPAVAGMLTLSIELEPGFEHVGTLNRADDLLKVCLEQRPHVVLLDVSMPGRDPFESLAEVAAKCPETRVIVFSGYEDRETVDRAIEAGAWGYIAKDLTAQEVFAAIRRVSEGHFVLPAI